MNLISDSAGVAAACAALAQSSFITVDTEFLRDSTFWPKLCLVQMAGAGKEDVFLIDPLAPGIDLAPLMDLMMNPAVLKVFHAARQDIEIFVHLSGRVPTPVFDTQVAAMVCGFGESASYETLVRRLAKASLDKASRFTDWARRPLTERQLRYALEDVTHLRVVYEKLAKDLERSGRAAWLEEEMAILTDVRTYETDPAEAWRRLKTRSTNRRFLAVLQEVAAFREIEAKRRDLPRSRILKDEALTEIAAHPPKTPADLDAIRAVPRGFAEGKLGPALMQAIEAGLARPPESVVMPPVEPDLPDNIGPLVDLLKVLLKTKCDEAGVAQKLVCSAADLERIAADENADVAALTGWRRELFGEIAIKLKRGEVALAAQGRKVKIVTLDPSPTA